jgi:hypothetical protein
VLHRLQHAGHLLADGTGPIAMDDAGDPAHV